MKRLLIAMSCIAFITLGCQRNSTPAAGGKGGAAGAPTKAFTLAWSEYPSWSVYGVAHEQGLIHKDEGKMGTLEEKWGVDIVLKQMDYDGCLAAYGTGTIDAVCITNMDALAPATGRNSVAILPTSTSDGADACIVMGVDTIEDLKNHTSYGLENTVSQYMFERALEESQQDPTEFAFKNLDPKVAAQAMQTNQDGYNSIVVWNPFVIQTLRVSGDKAKVLFDSTKIPEEIIDMVVVGDDALKQAGGEAFASAIIEAFYAVNGMLEDPATSDSTLVALGQNFASLGLDDMKEIVVQTKFYKTPQAGTALFDRADFQTKIMPKVVEFCKSHGITPSAPTIAFGDSTAQLRFDTKYMHAVGQPVANTTAAK